MSKDIVFLNQFNDSTITNHKSGQPINGKLRVLNMEIPLNEFDANPRQDFAQIIPKVTCPIPAPAVMIHVNYSAPNPPILGISTNMNPFLQAGYYYRIPAGADQFGYGAPEYFTILPTPFLYVFIAGEHIPSNYYLVKTITPFVPVPGDVTQINVADEQGIINNLFNTIFEE